MLYRKISAYIEEHFKSGSDKILLIEGARQIGKSYIIRDVGTRLFPNFVEINFALDEEGTQLFKKVRTTEEFYLTLSMVAGDKLGNAENTLVFRVTCKFLLNANCFMFFTSSSQPFLAFLPEISYVCISIFINEQKRL